MGSMTVIAFGRSSVPQLGHFAVKSLKIAFSHVLVTAAALVDNFKLESLLVSPGNGMGGVAVVTQRQWFISLGLTRKMDAGSELFVNAVVTFGTGLGNVVAVYAGTRITAGQLVVRSVAVSAHGRDH